MERYPIKSQDTAHRVLEGEAIAVNFKSSFFYAFNEVATFIWERCDGRHRVADIAAALTEEYDVDLAEAARDCQQFIGELETEGLLTWAPAP